MAVLAVLATGCDADGSNAQQRTDVPEPATAPPVALDLPGEIVALPGQPEGLAWDGPTATIAVAVRHPDGVVLVDAAARKERARVGLGSEARHLELAAPGGPVLVPSEGNDRLYRLALPGGNVIADSGVGHHPHDAAPAAGGAVFVGDELADTVTRVAPDGTTSVVRGPVQPGGVAASADGSVVVVVGVRGRRLEAFAPDGRLLGGVDCGVGPTHVRAGLDGLFYVADTQGGAVLVFRAGPDGVQQLGSVPTGGGAPYGLAVDLQRSRLFVTLTAKNQLRSYRIDGTNLVAERTWPTVRQPNDVSVDPNTGDVVVAGTADGLLQFLTTSS